MKIINTGIFYFGTDGTVYRGKIKLSEEEFAKVKRNIFRNKKASYHLSKNDLQKCPVIPAQYALGVTATDYIVSLFKNESRYHYKRQNYIIQVTK